MKPWFGRVGGKSKLARRIVAMIPKHKTYVEGFLGGGSVFLRKQKSEVEVINDLDKDMYFLWTDVRKYGDKVSEMDFKGSRKEFEKLKKQKKLRGMERFRRNIYLSKFSFASNRINYVHKSPPKNLSTACKKVKTRLQDVVILNKSWKTVVKKYDSEDTFMYLDPPYKTTKANWGYRSFSAKELIKVIKSVKGKFLLSFENDKASEKEFKNAGFTVKKIKTRYTAAPGKPFEKEELIVKNF